MNTYIWLLLSIWAVDLLALISPGPNFLMVSQTAMHRSRPYALAVALGVACGSAAWGTAVAAGLSALFGFVPGLHLALKLGGAAYLMYLGVQLWWNSGEASSGRVSATERSIAGAFLRGLLTNMLNPKSAAYYASVFTLFLPPGTPGWLQVAAITLISLTSALWHAAVALLFSTRTIQNVYAAMGRGINRAAGAVMAALGLRLLLARD